MNRIDFVNTDAFDYSCHTGVTFSADLITYESCTKAPNDLTVYTASMVIYDANDDIVLTLTGVIATPINGKIVFSLSALDTSMLTIGVYCHYINVTSADGTVYRLAEGAFEVNP
jgi:hypothetical protein